MKAFPNKGYESESLGNKYGGMDLRDYFAGLAMQSMLSWKEISNIYISQEAYMMADSMMEARNK
jgi:hypothetical protein